MLSPSLENLAKFIRWLLLIGIGILMTLLVISVVGGAVPTGTWTLNPNFLQGSQTNLTFSNPQNASGDLYIDSIPVPQTPAVSYSTEWHTLPIKAGLWIAASVVILSGVTLLWLGKTLHDISEEVFP